MPPASANKAILREAFNRAIAAARIHIGATAPNPPVGCTILSATGETLAVAAHRRAGQPHAEVLALQQCRAAGRIAEVDTLVVTLEPCNRTGRTPPCTDAILASPVRSVWIGTLDPDLARPGDGLRALRAAGIDVHLSADGGPILRPAVRGCAALIRSFAHRVQTGRPWIVVKRAFDVTGSMIPPAGATTFTSAASLRLAHAMRRSADTILTGSGTILADRPAFTVRHLADHVDVPPRRLLIVDRRRRVSADYVAEATRRGFTVSIVDDIGRALDTLGAAGALDVLVEAGPALSDAFFQSDLWDEEVRIERSSIPGGEDHVVRRYRLGDRPD